MPIPRAANEEYGGGRVSTVSTLRDDRWTCNICGMLDNWATRSRCRRCKAYGPKGSGGGGKGGGQGLGWKGAGKGIRSTGGAGTTGVARSWGVGTGGDSTSFAQRQLQRQQEDQRVQRVREEARKKEEALRAANIKLQKELTAATKGSQKHVDEDEGMEDDEESEESRQERIDATQKALPYLILQFGEGSQPVERARGEIEDLLRAAREAKPYKTHRGQLERRLDRLRKQQERAKEEEDEMLQEIETAQAKLNKLRAAMEERERNIVAADEELKDLLRKAIADEPTEPPSVVDPTAAWHTINRTLADMAAQPGVPPAWAAQLGGLLEQVRLAAVAIQQQAGTAPQTTMQPSSQLSPSTSSSKPPSQSSSPQSPPSPPAAAKPTEASTSRPAGTAASTSTGTWEARALELAFAEGSSSGSNNGGGKGGGGPSREEAGQDGHQTSTAQTGNEQSATHGNSATTPQAAATTMAAASTTTLPGDGFETGTDAEESDDEMASVAGADDLDKREGESAAQHRLRLARHLKERAARKKEERQREGESGKKKGDAKERQAARDKPHQKKK